MSASVNDAAFWSCRAAEARSVAGQMSDELCRNTMFALAARYERLANRATEGNVFGAVPSMNKAIDWSRAWKR